jgi:general secretion pathway protein K
MTPLSPGLNVRGDRFQMHHYRYCAGDPLKN